jgi:hypothetical protein
MKIAYFKMMKNEKDKRNFNRKGILKKVGMWFILLFILLAFSIQTRAEQYGKKVSFVGNKPSILDMNLGALNFATRHSETSCSLIIEGEDDNSVVINGYNHDLNGNLVGSGDKPAVQIDIGEENVTTNNVLLYGAPSPTVGNVDITNLSIISELVNYVRQNADITITTDTTYTNTTIGGEDDYRFVYVDNSNLTLGNNFVGYGILVINDSTPTGNTRLDMEGNAKWYGLVVCYQHDLEGSTEETIVKMNGSGTEDEIADVGSYALLAIDNIMIGNNLNISGGNVGVTSASGVFQAGNNARFANSLIANTIIVGNNCSISGDVYYNIFNHGNNFSLGGEVNTPLSFPFVTLPSFPDFDVGTQDISKGHNQTVYLNPGSYHDISFGNNGKLYFTGGEYYINKIDMGNNPRIYFQGFSTIHIKKKISFGNNPRIESDGQGLDASDCIFYIEGNGYSSNTTVFSMGNNARINCNIYAPNNRVMAGNNIHFSGAIIARKFICGNNPFSSFDFKSAFEGGTSQKARIYGAVLLGGRKFYIPNEGGNAEILYSLSALEKADEEIQSKPYSWKQWQEIE